MFFADTCNTTLIGIGLFSKSLFLGSILITKIYSNCVDTFASVTVQIWQWPNITTHRGSKHIVLDNRLDARDQSGQILFVVYHSEITKKKDEYETIKTIFNKLFEQVDSDVETGI